MSTKYFCDRCDKEIDAKEASHRIRRRLDSVMIEVMRGVGNTWNAGHVCDDCVIKVVVEGRNMTDREYTQVRTEGLDD